MRLNVLSDVINIKMAESLIILTAMLLYGTSISFAANILAIFPLPSPSHNIWNSPLLVALAKRGHNVFVISPQSQKSIIPNLIDFTIQELNDVDETYTNFEDSVDEHPLNSVDVFLKVEEENCVKILKSKEWLQILNLSKDTKFDLIIIEPMGIECLLPGVIQKFGNPPIVAINAFNVPPWLFEMIGSPNLISSIPNHMLAVTDKMSFFERVQNFYFNAYIYYHYHYNFIPKMEKEGREFYGQQIQSFYDFRKGVCLALVNTHPILDHGYSRTPNLISVGGIQVKEPEPLQKDIQTYLDGAKEGAIFFSFGTNIQFHLLTPEKIRLFLDAFAEIPQRVLWKYEADSLPGQPTNVKIGKWLPQSDILAHPNVKLFITHSGLLSTHEAIYRGVPIIGIPIFAEQPINIQKVVRHGAGIRLNYKYLTKELIKDAIKTVLTNNSYAKNMKQLSNVFRDDLNTPLEKAVFWAEYVLRHKGAPHLQSAAKDLNILQLISLDVVAFLLVIPAFLTLILCCIWRRKRKEVTKRKRN